MLCNISSFPEMRSHEELMEMLTTPKAKYVICPPPLLFAGRLCIGIKTLYPLMYENTQRDFEGCFIVLNDNSDGFKWKTGMFEEQQYIPPMEILDLKEDESREVYQLLVNVYECKSKVVASEIEKPLKAPKKGNDQLNDLISIAFNREQSKSVSYVEIPKRERVPIINDYVDRIVIEIISRYESDEIPCPWSQEQIRKSANQTVTSKIMRDP